MDRSDVDQPLTRENEVDALFLNLFQDLSKIKAEYGGQPVNVRLDRKHDRQHGVANGPTSELRLRVTAIDGGLNQEEMEGTFKVLERYHDQDPGHGLYAEIQNNGLEIWLMALSLTPR